MKWNYEYIDSQDGLSQLCDQLRNAPHIALDTEFVSEDCYEPDLCLVQLAIDDRLILVDPKKMSTTQPLWDLLAEGDHQTIVHSGREEFRFCWRATGKRLANLFDVQLAAGFTGLEYPAAYSTLVSRLADQTLDKGETRTNWRTRPLSPSQLSYAVQDVVHLNQIRNKLIASMEKHDRWNWYLEEMESWQRETIAFESSERWRRLSGSGTLSRRGLEILRVIWEWREGQAQQRNRPVRRILRDDLITELAKRETGDLRRIRSLRGLERSDLKRFLPEIADMIQEALRIPAEDCPKKISQKSNGSQLRLLGQFLVAAAGCFCRDAGIAASLVGAAQDYRDYAAHRMGISEQSKDEIRLYSGWRREFIAPMIDDLLDGRLAVRIDRPTDDQPLALERLESES